MSVTVVCSWCSEQFEVRPSREDTAEYCGMECKSESMSQNMSGDSNPAYKEKIVKQCKLCGDEFEVRPSRVDRIEFCSDDCRNEWRSTVTGEEHPRWNGGNVSLVCEYCGDEYERKPASAEESRFCSRECRANWRSENKSGKNSHLWKGGHVQDYGYYFGPHREIVRSYYSVCQRCGEDTDWMDVHHIKPYRQCDTDKEANRLDNLILLCRGCHKKIEHGLADCPEPDSTERIMNTLDEPCHDWCIDYAENPQDVLDEIVGRDD